MRRVAAVGLDAAEWQVVARMLDEGQLPNLARIRERGATCSLVNEAMYRSTLVWESFLTGREDAADERSGGVAFEPARYRAVKIPAGSASPFWACLPGVRTIAFDVPHLAAADAGSDIRVCTWGAHSLSHPRASRPPGLIRQLDRTVGRHPAFRREHRYAWHCPAFVDWLTQALVTGCQRRADAAAWLLRRFPDWRLLLAVMSETHSVGENLGYVLDDTHPLCTLGLAGDHGARLREVYRAADAAIGRLAEQLPPDTVLVVFSVHGTAPNDSELTSTVLLPELLHRLHFGRPFVRERDHEAWKRDGQAIAPAPGESWEDYMRACAGASASGVLGRVATRGLHRALRLAGRLADVSRDLARGRLGESADASLEWQVAAWYRSHWPRMKAFVLPTFADARLRINLRGRERDGIVERADYDRVCRETEDTMRACRDPRTGSPVVARTWRPRAHDPMARGGPDADIVVQWSRPVDALEHPAVGRVGPFPFRRTGAHSPRGFAVFAGPGVPRTDLGQWPAIDLPATIAALLGQRTPSGLDGRPIPGLCRAVG
jgi:predicted AlkP superfamily phosphohydrolase/phosphomutase